MARLGRPGRLAARRRVDARGQLGRPRGRLRPAGDGRFVHDGPEFVLPGRWSLRADALVGDFEQVSLEARIDLRPASP